MTIATKEDLEVASDALLDDSYCTDVEHFFNPGARDLIARFLPSFLDSLVITPTELVYSAKYQKRLHDAGRVLLNCVDKVATLQARHKGESSAKRVRELHALVSAASKKVWDDEKERPVPSMTPETFQTVVAAKGPRKGRDHFLLRMVTEHLIQYKVWRDKIAVLVTMLEVARGSDDWNLLEPMLGECLRSDPAMDQLFGLAERLEVRCNDLVGLWKGELQPRDGLSDLVMKLNALIAEGNAPNLRAGVEFSLLRTLAGKMPIRSAEPEIEVQALFELFRAMWLGNTLIGGSKALALLEKRQARYINTECVTDLLRERKVLADRILYLLQLNQIAIGQGNRATLKTFIDHYFGDRDFVPRVVSGQDPPVPKMQVLSGIYKTLRTSNLSDDEKVTYMAQTEAAQAELLKRSRLFEQIDKKGGGPAQKVLTLLDMCRKGTFIEGRTLDSVRLLIERYVQMPEFLPDYLSGATGEERERKVQLLIKTLASTGVRFGG